MDFDKLASPLAAAYERYVQEGRTRGPLVRQTRMLGFVSVRERAKPVRVVVSLSCDPDVTPDATWGEGIELNHGGHEVRTAIVTLDALDRLAGNPAVKRIAPAAQLRPCLHAAQARTGTAAFRTGSGLTGRDVVVGVVDTGIDPRHPVFAGRIERIWDQTMPGSGVAEGGYGTEFTGAGLATAALSRDTEGHGTHVAGIAAGKEGVAPDARLVVVKTDFMDAHIIDGIQYVFRVADELGLPAVVNLSLGGHFDPHDGTDLMSQAIEEASGPGRIVCCAAGNEGDDDIHARITVPDGSTRTVPCHPGILDGAPDVFALNGWYSGSDRFDIAMVSPSGASTPFQAVRPSGSPVSRHQLPEGTVELVTPGPDRANGDHNFFVGVEPTGHGPATAPGGWRLVVRAREVTSGVVDVWMLGSADARPQAQFSGRAVHDALKIGSPGTASSAVTVAAFTSRTEWDDIDGITREASWLAAEDIASFSSEGPRRDGAPKPDIAAPGAMLVAALSRDAVGVRREFMTDTKHVAMQGTSMAAPFVTGITALLLQRDPELGPAGLKDMLRADATVIGGTPGVFDPKWGHGLVSATGL
ncbi:S8 family serine peptidase [Streptomyces pristinaespiralis]|uniref:Peptidase S8 and S53 n=2 Tax=Streptomyces pristinaespiralis TaxID=38300 RepID=D6X859_STRE2|nr:S8 family serine peptidase [Streptomyces pristinaespiralis]ALC23517.1 peptidase S8 [Streptomyces pristinaespiralis]EFH31715.1 peptidase S8 and S53 [Streptomyces pristinaespiralis ATCC 25486]QMU14021.1 S8 family serine peptidase [Streptomyces pristinaespiralis]